MPDLRSLPRTSIRGHPDVVPTNPGSGPGQTSGTVSKLDPGYSPGTLDSGFRRNDRFSVDRQFTQTLR